MPPPRHCSCRHLSTSTYASGLPTEIVGFGGVVDVAFVGDTAYALVTLVGSDVGGSAVNGIYRIDDAGRTVYLAQAGPILHNPADGKVVSFPIDEDTPSAQTIAAGYSLLVDVQLSRCGVLFALSQGDSPGVVVEGSPALPESGELLRAHGDGTFSVVAGELNLPTSLEIVKKTAYIVTLGGEVLTVTNALGPGDCRSNIHNGR